jgi:hypothetical protein
LQSKLLESHNAISASISDEFEYILIGYRIEIEMNYELFTHNLIVRAFLQEGGRIIESRGGTKPLSDTINFGILKFHS